MQITFNTCYFQLKMVTNVKTFYNNLRIVLFTKKEIKEYLNVLIQTLCFIVPSPKFTSIRL